MTNIVNRSFSLEFYSKVRNLPHALHKVSLSFETGSILYLGLAIYPLLFGLLALLKGSVTNVDPHISHLNGFCCSFDEQVDRFLYVRFLEKDSFISSTIEGT